MKQLKKLIVTLLIIVIFTSMLPLTASASGTIAWGAANVSGSSVRIRSGPGLDHSILTHANRGDIVVVIERTNNEWHKVNFHGTIGYMSVSFLERHREAANFNKSGSISGRVVNMRARPTTTSSVLASHRAGTVMNIIGINNGWYKVEHGAQTGYVRSDLMALVPRTAAAAPTAVQTATPEAIPVTTPEAAPTTTPEAAPVTTPTATPAPAPVSTHVTPSGPAPDPNLDLGQQIADYASSYVGHRYVWGGQSPSTGFDCSGLVSYVMRQYGVRLTRTASGQYRDNGTHIDKSELVPGDLVFFSNNGHSVTHVGIYVGDGKFVHASGTNTGVIISSLDSPSRIRTWFGAKRVV
jgi:cell wall-associated NlpC family hydrolase